MPSRKWLRNDSYLGVTFWKIFSPPLLSPGLRMRVIIFQHCCGAGENWMQLGLVKMPQILLFLPRCSHVSWRNTSPCCYQPLVSLQSIEKLILIISHTFMKEQDFRVPHSDIFTDASLSCFFFLVFLFLTTHLVMENHPFWKKQWQRYLSELFMFVLLIQLWLKWHC